MGNYEITGTKAVARETIDTVFEGLLLLLLLTSFIILNANIHVVVVVPHMPKTINYIPIIQQYTYYVYYVVHTKNWTTTPIGRFNE